MKTTVLLLTLASLTALNGAEQQAPILPTTPKNPKSLIEITFEKIYGKKEQYKLNIQKLVEQDDVDKVRFFLFGPKNDFDKHFLLILLRNAQSKEMKKVIIFSPRFDVNLKNSLQQTLLHRSLDNHAPLKDPEISELLIEAGANVNAKDIFKQAPLHLCNNPLLVALLIKAGADVNTCNKFGETPLHIYLENEEIVKLLIKAKANVNARNKYGKTPLHQCRDNNFNVARLLIINHANVNAQDNDGDTPLYYIDTIKITTLLIVAGANVNAKNNYGLTPLHGCVDHKSAQLMITAGADVNAQCKSGHTPLHCAMLMNMAQLLIKNGANPCIPTQDGKFPYQCRENDYLTTRDYLRQEYDKRMALMEIHKQAFAQIHAKRKD